MTGKPVFRIIYVINEEDDLKQEPGGAKQSKRSWYRAVSPEQKKAEQMSEAKMLDALLDAASDCTVNIELYDTCCTKKTTAFGARYADQSEQVQYHQRQGKTVLQCFNEGLEQAQENEWVNCIRSAACYDGSVLTRVAALIQDPETETKVVCLAPYQYTNGKLTSQVYYRRRNCVIDLADGPYYLNLCPDSAFIRGDQIGALRFPEEIAYEPEAYFMTQVLELAGSYYAMNEQCRIRAFLENDPYNYEPVFEKDWYEKAVRQELLPFLLDGKESEVRQAAVVYLSELKFFANADGKDKSILSEEERKSFYEAVSELYQQVDDDVLCQYKWEHRRVLQRFMGANLLRLKYRDYAMQGRKAILDPDPEVSPVVVMGPNDTVVESLHRIHFRALAINYEDGFLKIDGEVMNVYFTEPDQIRFWADCSGERIEAERTEIYSYSKYFGIPVKKGYMVQIRIPEDRLKSGLSIRMIAEFEESQVVCRCKFAKIQTHLSSFYQKSYWRFGPHILSYRSKERCIRIRSASLFSRLYHELRFEAEMKSWKALAMRTAYFVTKPVFGRKKIWLTFDQLFKGGDNGEYFFRYVNEHHRNDAELYYIVNADTKEYRELKAKYGRVLKYPSPLLLLLSLHAKMIFATRVDVRLYCGYKSWAENYIRDLFNAEVVCLQHGLTIQKIAQYQNRLFDNLKYYFCVSPLEVKNIENPLYGYTPDQLKLTGAPRYDGLKGKPKRQILITPTWRRNVTAGTNQKGSNHAYSVNFRHTAYYEVYNTLINDSRLIACAKRTNYKLIYLIHPILSPQADDFDKNEFVEIRPGVDVNYEQILKESSLMITDYSGIQFDFAYMRRPLVYYHPDKLPPQYEPGVFQYEENGFGPVCRNNDEVVEAICHYMENDCALDEEYRQRIETFFPFDDQENCRRVYEAAEEFWKNKK